MDPFSLAALGVAALGSGVSAGINAAGMPAAKRKYIRESKADALHKMRRNYAASLSNYPLGQDGRYIANQIQKTADEKFQVDPLSFVPFVQNATKFAGGLYDAGLDKPLTDEEKAEEKRKRDELEAASQQDVLRPYPIV